MNAFLARFAHHDLSRHDQDFLARDGEILARLDRRQRRPQAACPDDRDQHHVGVRQASEIASSPAAPEKTTGS